MHFYQPLIVIVFFHKKNIILHVQVPALKIIEYFQSLIIEFLLNKISDTAQPNEKNKFMVNDQLDFTEEYIPKDCLFNPLMTEVPII